MYHPLELSGALFPESSLALGQLAVLHRNQNHRERTPFLQSFLRILNPKRVPFLLVEEGPVNLRGTETWRLPTLLTCHQPGPNPACCVSKHTL